MGPATFLMSLSPTVASGDPVPRHPYSLYLCGPCLSKPLRRTGAPIQPTHPSGAGVNRNGGLTHRASREPTRSSPALTTHPTWSSIAGLRQGPTQARGLAHSVAEKREMIQHTSKELRGERP